MNMRSTKTLKSAYSCDFGGINAFLWPHHVHLLFAVSAACPITPNGYGSDRHQEDNHHIVIQQGLIGGIHGNQSSFTKCLQELHTC